MANKFWSSEMLQALRQLAELSTKYRSNGSPFPRKDWESGLQKLQSQDIKAYKMLKNISLKQIKWTWTKYQDVAYGYCATSKCTNKIEPGEFYCKTCRPAGSMYHRGAYSSPCISDNLDVVKRTIAGYSEKDLKQVVTDSIGRMPYRIRKNILGKEYVSLLVEKESKKKK